MQGAASGCWWVEGLLTVALFSPGQICIFVGETLLFSNWAITADILMVRPGLLTSWGSWGG